jgi:hypothetical protein
MEKTFGLQRLFHNIRYRRDRFRQFLGISFAILVSAVGKPKPILFIAGTVLVLLGIATRIWASGHIKKNKVLATDGPYGFVRHPLYVGNITLGIGFALASGLWWSIPLLILILWGFYPPAIQYEDEKLHRLFKEDWEKWRGQTRALIPRITAFGRHEHGSWSFWQSLRQNGEPLIALFLLFCLYYIYLKL